MIDQHGEHQHDEALLEGELDDAMNHLWVLRGALS